MSGSEGAPDPCSSFMLSVSARRFVHVMLCAFFGAGVAFACRSEVLETAFLPPDPSAGGALGAGGGGGGEAGAPSHVEPLDCSANTGTAELPPGTVFGQGDTADDWPLVSASYGAQEGPGLYVTARDTFRVYVDGHLVAESAGVRTPTFVPVSLVPGENVVAISVYAASGTPALLAQLDELSGSFVTGAHWKVSSAPEANWQAPGFDDAGWASARDLGGLGSLPGCDPEDTFPASSTARWIGGPEGSSGALALRVTIRVEPLGFGAGTTGAAEAAPTVVTSYAELARLAGSDEPAFIVLPEGVYDFRRTGDDVETIEVCPNVCSEDPEKTTLQGSADDCGQTPLTATSTSRRMNIGSNKTILGLGRGALVRGVTFQIDGSENVIVRNLALYDINPHLFEAGDAFTVEAASRVWLDHVTAKWVSDAHADVLPGTTATTFSYLLFDGENDAECTGRERWMTTINDSEVTIHHSRFDEARTRAPAAQGESSRVHLFNNVFSNTTDWTVGSTCLAEVLLEGSVFENVQAAVRLGDCSDDTGLGKMSAASGGNLYRDESRTFLGGDGTEPGDAVFEPPYDYPLEPANEALSRVISRAGAGGPWAQQLDLR